MVWPLVLSMFDFPSDLREKEVLYAMNVHDSRVQTTVLSCPQQAKNRSTPFSGHFTG